MLDESKADLAAWRKDEDARLRDEVAMRVLAAIVSADDISTPVEKEVRYAFIYADELMKQRGER